MNVFAPIQLLSDMAHSLYCSDYPKLWVQNLYSKSVLKK